MKKFEEYMDGASAREIMDLARSLPDEYMEQKKALCEVWLKMIKKPEKKEPVVLDIENFADPCDV